MPSVYYRGDRFVHRIKLKRLSPLYHQFPTWEYQQPFRHGMGHVFHLPPFKSGLVVGRFSRVSTDEEYLLYEAVQGRPLEDS